MESEVEVEKKKDKKIIPKQVVETLPKVETTCLHGTEVKAIKFDFTHIDNLLANMCTPQEKIRWLKTYLKQLRQSQRTMYLSAQGLPTLRSVEEQYDALTPYNQIYPVIINKIQNKIRKVRTEIWQKK